MMRKDIIVKRETDKDYQKAKAIYEELLKEYPRDRRQIEMEWKENPTLQNMEELKGIAEAFF